MCDDITQDFPVLVLSLVQVQQGTRWQTSYVPGSVDRFCGRFLSLFGGNEVEIGAVRQRQCVTRMLGYLSTLETRKYR